MNNTDSAGGYIVEFVVIGNSVKVSAMDPETLTEVSIIGPRSASQQELQGAAIRKLQYVMEKGDDSTTLSASAKPKGRGGILV